LKTAEAAGPLPARADDSASAEARPCSGRQRGLFLIVEVALPEGVFRKAQLRGRVRHFEDDIGTTQRKTRIRDHDECGDDGSQLPVFLAFEKIDGR
jgi:hypothetical protein